MMPTLFARRLVPTALAALAGLCVLPGHAHAQCQYDVTILQFPIDCGIGTVITSGLSLNEDGAVVGSYKCPISKYSQGFLWTAEGGFVGLDPPPGVIEVILTDINDQGVICGTMIVADIGKRGFVYDHGVWTVLPPVVDMLGTWSSAAAISNAGVVVGQRSITENLNPQNAYIWSADEGFTDLGVMKGPNSAATAISEAGLVAGWSGSAYYSNGLGFLSNQGRVTMLGPIPDGLTSTPWALSEDTTVVGFGEIPMDGFPSGVPRAFLWRNAEFTMLGTLPDHLVSGAYDIRSEPLQIVGFSKYVDGNPNISHGFIWQTGAMRDLNSLVQTEPGIVIRSAGAINSGGVIVANGSGPQGVVTFLLTPVESPVGDLDADCEVGILDLLILLAAWGEAGSPADLNNDGLVGILDLLTLLANWT
ncbi:MAG: hypothetical protein IH830_03755 [Planctomycetes bacterium]|nr:hypothetical protein [Planctomycetota bacterium]